MEAGTRIGSYEIIAPIDAGGMGVVYRARHVDLGREVAIKVLLPNLMLSEKIRNRFKQEAYIQAQLKHPQIVRVEDTIQESQHHAIVMELIEGGTLAGKLQETPWSEENFTALFTPVVNAVAYAHSRGVVHRDIKPENILLTLEGTPKVTDFGIAKILAGDSGMTRTGAKLGTIPYMSPEQFKGQKELGTEADVYALGMLAWRMLTGKLPFDDPDNIEAAFNHYQGTNPTPAVQTLAPNLSPGLARLVDACLSIDPSQRPKDAGVIEQLLANVSAEKASAKESEDKKAEAAAARPSAGNESTYKNQGSQSRAGFAWIVLLLLGGFILGDVVFRLYEIEDIAEDWGLTEEKRKRRDKDRDDDEYTLSESDYESGYFAEDPYLNNGYIDHNGGPHLGVWVIDMDWHLSTPELRDMPVEEREFMINMYSEMTVKFTEDKFILDAGGDTEETDYSITKKDGNSMTIRMAPEDGGREVEVIVEGDKLTLTPRGEELPLVLKRK